MNRTRSLAEKVVAIACLFAFYGAPACDRAPATGAPSQPADRAAPRRIITLAPNAAEMIAALGLADRIVGVDDFCVYPPELTTRPRVGGLMDPDLETIAILKPDLVVVRGRIPTVEALCADRGIAVHYDRTDSFDDIFESLESLGRRLRRTKAARDVAESIRRDIGVIHERVAHLDRPRVLMCFNRDAEAIRNVVTVGRGTFIDEVIRLAGGENAFGDMAAPYPQVGVEEILAARPDVIIEAIEARRATEALRDALRSQWQALPAIPAARTGRIHILTEDYLMIPSPRVVDSVRRLACVLHPEVACD